MNGKYKKIYKKSIEDPVGFWGEAAENVHWYKKWDKVLDESKKPFYKWFTGGVVNSCYNALDLHVENGRGSQLALIYDSPVTETKKEFTYLELLDQVARFAGVLQGMGVEKGDTVIIYMPMVPEAIIAMLACARIGAVHSVIFAGFSAEAIADRNNDASAKVQITANGLWRRGKVLPLKATVDEALAKSPSVEKCIVLK
ncbi:MAG: AMP-binding protein, partial [Thermodesulfobacteriota bacterium]